jgi:prepilin-type N-terminal cleavage/methylation domain-containing protein
MKKRGFTLVELLVVIAILAILATVTTVGYVTFINNTNQQKADTEAAQIKKAIEVNGSSLF